MRDFDWSKGEYLPRNAEVLKVDVDGSGIHIRMRLTDEVHTLQLPLKPDVVSDLCRIFGVDSLYDGEGKYVRALGFANWDNGVYGIADILEDFGLSAISYYVNGLPENGPAEKDATIKEVSSIFTMATMDPPPGLPWTLNKVGMSTDSSLSMEILDEDGEVIAWVTDALGNWIFDKAKLAKLKE